MEGRLTCVLRTVVFLLGCWRLSAFNLDTDNVNEMKGPADSLFGFSIALHWQVSPHDSRILLVGAPRADGWSGQTAKVTGGLYSCDMTAGATCIRVQFDEKDNPKKESKENQWMGVSVNSQGPGGKILTCAHRYQRRNGVGTSIESRDIIGRCYVLSQTLSIDTSDQEEGGSWHFCDNRPRGHEMFGSCQQGVSATFDDDYHYLIFGAPGAYNWKGVVRLEQKNNTFVDNFIFDDGPFELGDENEKNPDLVPAPPNSYLGFSLDSGKRVTSKDELTVVAGAPRANHSGAVVLLKKGQERNLLEEYTLEGEGLASSFGYDLAVLDLNNDGWKDIVVGAPQYFEKDGEIGGAVYVYVNKAGKWNKVKPTRIDGPQDSMFGLAVENLGDINLDDFNDFAVGAPFDNDGAGNVYIYHGAANGLSSKEAAQVLSGKPGVKQFGYSLAGNIDLDKNSYPDLAVGSLSDSVFVYRARPVINIVKEIVFTPKEIDLTKKNCDNNNNFCLEVKVCLSYTASPQSYAPRLTVAYTLEVDAERVKNRINPRATIYGTNSHRYIGIVSMDRKGEKTCFKRSLVIQENIKDKLHGIPVNVSVDIKGANRKRRQSFASQMTPVLDAKAPATTQSEVQFLKVGCGEDNVCRSKLMVECRYGHRSSDKEFTPLDREGDMQVTSLSDQRDIALEVKVSNLDGDDAHEANVIATFPRYLTYSAYHQADTTADKVSCTANKDGSQVGCDLGNPFKRGSVKTFYITLGTSGISANITELEVDLQLNTTSNQGNIAPYKAKAKVNIVLQLPLSGQAVPSQVYFTGEAKDEDAIKTESAIGSAITHQFRIINLGKSLKDFGDVALHITWPKETTEGKRLLYLMKISSTGVDQIDCSPKGEINPRGIEPSNTRERRAAGKSQGTGEGTLSRLLDKKKYKTLSCDNNGGATCVTIKCPLRGMDSNAVFTLNSRLWNATFIEEYSKLHHVEVIVKASLHIDSTTTVLENAETQVMLTVFPERNEARYTGGSPWWIILLSILFALLLLALLAFLLWKCGVFGKKNK